MSTNTLTCGEALVALLEDYGTEVVFGIPGNHTLELYRGLENSPIRHVLARHEQGAAFMADGYARSSGKVGVCFLITGPGITNAATAMAQAFSDSQPMLVISSVNSTATMGKSWGEVHELRDQASITRPFTAFTATALTPDELPSLLARAYSVFRSERPRPVHIEIPIDVFEIPVPGRWSPFNTPAAPAPNPDALAEAVALLSAAERPAMIIGGGATHAGQALTTIADKLACSVLPTVAANGTIADSHPFCLGPRMGAQSIDNFVEQADVVLAIGTEMSINEGTGPDPLPTPGKLIRIDIDPQKLVDRVPADIAIWADAKLTAEALAVALPDNLGATRRETLAKMVAVCRKASDELLTDLQKKHIRVTDIIQDVMPADTLYATDMTQIVYTTRSTMGFEMLNRMMNPKGYGTLGYALPVAIGAKIANPDTPVVAIAGDHGVMYTIQELATAADEGAGVILIVWNNASLAEIRDGFRNLNVTPIGVELLTPDFQMMGQSMGFKTALADTPDALRKALNEAHASGKPTLIEVSESGDF